MERRQYRRASECNRNKYSEKIGCNCRQKEFCPLNNQCMTPRIVYQAEVMNDKNQEKEDYIVLTETTFKERHRNHTKSFNNKKHP